MIDTIECVDEMRLLDYEDELRSASESEPESHHCYDYEEEPFDYEEVTTLQLDIADWDEDSGLRHPDLEPEDWIEGGTKNPNYYPLLQDLDERSPIFGRAVKCAQRLARKCNQTNPHESRARAFQQKCQQEAVAYLLKHQGKRIKNFYLDQEVLRAVNHDFEQFQPDKSKQNNDPRIPHDPALFEDRSATASAVPGYYHNLRELDIEWLLSQGHTVEQTANKLGTSESTVYRVKRQLKPRLDEHNRERAKRAKNRRLPLAERRLPWKEVGKQIKLPNVASPSKDLNKRKDIKPDDWPTPHSRLYAECHARGTADCELINRYLDGRPLNEAERDRLRELAYSKKYL